MPLLISRRVCWRLGRMPRSCNSRHVKKRIDAHRVSRRFLLTYTRGETNHAASTISFWPRLLAGGLLRTPEQPRAECSGSRSSAVAQALALEPFDRARIAGAERAFLRSGSPHSAPCRDPDCGQAP